MIDIGVSAPSSRKNLQVSGIPIDWAMLTKKYKNIENDSVNSLAIDVVPTSQEDIHNCETDTSKTLVQSTDEIEMHKIVYKVAKVNYIKECIQWVADCQKAKREQNPIPQKPEKPRGMIDYRENGQNATDYDIANHFIRDEIFRYIESRGGATFNKIKSDCPSVQDMTDQRIRGWIDTLIQKKEISKDSNNIYSVVYKKNSDWEIKIDITENDLLVYETYIKGKENERIKKEKEKLTIEDTILTALKGAGPITFEELLEREPALNEHTNMHILFRLSQLAEKKKIKITEVMRCKYFECK